MHCMAKGIMLRGCIINVVLVRVVVDHDSEEVVLKLATLHASCISIQVSLVGLFKL